MGCAAALVAVMIFGVVLAVREQPTLFSELATMSEYATPATSAAALDSLEGMNWAPLGRARSDRLALKPVGTANGAVIAATVWSNRRLVTSMVPYGDTALSGTRRNSVWRSYAHHAAVDSLIDAARKPWRLTGEAIDVVDSTRGILATTLSPYVVMNTTRAMLARAAVPQLGDGDQPTNTVVVFVADSTAARAVVTIARALEADPVLIHVVTGLRVERDALAFLAKRGSADAVRSLAQAEEALAAGLRGLHLIRIAGAMPDHSAVLAKAAGDPSLPIAVRRELLISIGYGWALNAQEVGGTGPSRERIAVLARLEAATLPVALRPALATARAAARLGMFARGFTAPEYQTLTAALRTVW